MIMYFNKWGWLFDRERRAVNREVLKGMELRKNAGYGLEYPFAEK